MSRIVICGDGSLPDSREINTAIQALPNDFDVWTSIWNDPMGIARLKADGQAMLQRDNSHLERILDNSEVRILLGEMAVIVNTPILQSEVCDRIFIDWPSIDVAVAYYEKVNDDGDHYYHYSIRTRTGSGVRADQIAAHWGGGGHPQAAGFKSMVRPVLITEPLQWEK